MYCTDTTRSRTPCSTILLQSVSIQIQRYMYSSMCIVQIQLALELACSINNTSVCINPDTTLYVFLMYIVQIQFALELACPINNTSVCIKPDTTISVFLNWNP